MEINFLSRFQAASLKTKSLPSRFPEQACIILFLLTSCSSIGQEAEELRGTELKRTKENWRELKKSIWRPSGECLNWPPLSTYALLLSLNKCGLFFNLQQRVPDCAIMQSVMRHVPFTVWHQTGRLLATIENHHWEPPLESRSDSAKSPDRLLTWKEFVGHTKSPHKRQLIDQLIVYRQYKFIISFANVQAGCRAQGNVMEHAPLVCTGKHTSPKH